MIVKILGIIDILAAATFWMYSFFHIFPASFIMILALFLIAKGAAFVISDHFASIGDIIAGVLIFVSIDLAMPAFIVIIITLYVLQKGVFSFL
ncbi:MAG: hypothetical protein WCP89_01100 [archaeon]